MQRRPNRSRKSGTYQPHVSFNRNPGNNVILRNVVKWFDQGTVTSTSGASGLYAFSFQLADIPDASSFSSIFDQYKIDQVDVTILPLTLPSAPGATYGFALLWCAVDYDDSVAPGSVSSVTNYSNSICVGPGKSANFTFKPKISGDVDQAGTPEASYVTNAWLNCTKSSVPHYGFKIGVTQSTTTNLTAWRVLTRYHIGFRSCR